MPKPNDSLPGITQWFRVGEEDRVRKAIHAMNELKIHELRILFSWADWETEKGPEWFDLHIPLIARETEARLVPVLFYTPLGEARLDAHGQARTSYPPRDLSHYSGFVKEMIERYGDHFDWLQIWNEPNWKPYWDWDLDPDARLFSEMAIPAAAAIHAAGKKAALGGLSPYEPAWITLIHEHGLLAHLDAVGMHYSPSWDDQRRRWLGWEAEIATARAHLTGLGSNAEVWIAETGYSTLASSEAELRERYEGQIAFFEETRKARADKAFWYSIFDQESGHLTDNEINMAGRKESAAYHFGLIDAKGRKKPLYERWKKNVTSVDID